MCDCYLIKGVLTCKERARQARGQASCCSVLLLWVSLLQPTKQGVCSTYKEQVEVQPTKNE
jgi:hypothetical protein